MALSDNELGYIAVCGAIVFFGSFAVPLKMKRVQEADVDPVVFQLYYSLSIFCSSWIVLTYVPFVFTPFGIVGASLWVPASILSIAAINYLGMSISVGIWCGVTVITSFLWGALAFPSDNPVKNFPLSIVALMLLIIGIIGLSISDSSFIKDLGKLRKSHMDINNVESTQTLDGSPLLLRSSEYRKSISTSSKERSHKEIIIGLLCALILGVMNGSMMVPLHFTPPDATGINYIVSFGIGVLIVTPICSILYFVFRWRVPKLQVRVALLPGLITGFIWNVGNFCSIYATLYLGLTIGFPLTQLALVVSGLWGIVVFHELSGLRTLSIWTLSLLILLGGAALLALNG